MSRTLIGAAGATAVALSMVAATAVAATPEATESHQRGKKVFGDRLGDAGRGYDIAKLGVWNKSSMSTYYIAVTGRFSAKRAQLFHVFVDTNPRNKGPEYRIIAHSNRDPKPKQGVTVAKVKGFGDNGTVKRCGEKKARWRVQKKDQIDLTLKKSCLGGKHRRIRVSTEVWDVRKFKQGGGWKGDADGAPGIRKLSGWVRS